MSTLTEDIDIEHGNMTAKEVLRAQLAATLLAGYLANPNNQLRSDADTEIDKMIELADNIIATSWTYDLNDPPTEER